MAKVKKERTALIVVDMQKDVLEQRGRVAFYGIWRHAEQQQTVANTKKAIEKARKAGIPIVYLQIFTRPEFLPDVGPARSLKESGAFRRGTEGAQIVEELKPQPHDYVVEKHKANGFYNSELQDVLNGLKCNTLVFAGVATNFCVEATVRGASDRRYRIVVLSDCVATMSEEMQEFALKVMFPMFGEVTTTDELEITP